MPVERLRSDSARSPDCPRTPPTRARGTAWASGREPRRNHSAPSSAQTTLPPSSPPIAPSTVFLRRTRPRRAFADRGSGRRSRRWCRRTTREARGTARTDAGPDVGSQRATHDGEQRERDGHEKRRETERTRPQRRGLDRREAHEREERARPSARATSTVARGRGRRRRAEEHRRETTAAETTDADCLSRTVPRPDGSSRAARGPR